MSARDRLVNKNSNVTVNDDDDDANDKKRRFMAGGMQKILLLSVPLLLCAGMFFVIMKVFVASRGEIIHKEEFTNTLYGGRSGPFTPKTLPADYVRKLEPLPDKSAQGCKGEFDRIVEQEEAGKIKLPSTSIIFCFCNEPQESLYHSIHSVLERSRFHLIHEIILVDDGGDAPHIGRPLKEYVEKLPVPVKIIRLGRREGLMRARVRGAEAATGETLTFLDSHIEPNVGWLTFLMWRIQDSKASSNRQFPDRVVFPIIDGLTKQFQYNKGGIELVGWNARLQDHGMPLQGAHKFAGRKPWDAQPSPAMAGGLFSIDRQYFFEIGGFDEGMLLWGGENIEISWRIWMCGGSLEMMPCSRVAHVFGGMGHPKCSWNKGENPGSYPSMNKWRAMKTWMDGYEDVIELFFPYTETGDINNMLELRKSLKCHNFQWFLDNVYPDCWLNSITKPYSVQPQGFLQNVKSGKCVTNKGGALMDCPSLDSVKQGHIPSHWWFTTAQHEFLTNDPDMCMEFRGANSPTTISFCHGHGNQKWHRNELTIKPDQQYGNLCLDGSDPNGIVKPKKCDGSDWQNWKLLADEENLPLPKIKLREAV